MEETSEKEEKSNKDKQSKKTIFFLILVPEFVVSTLVFFLDFVSGS